MSDLVIRQWAGHARQRLDAAQIDAALTALPGWRREGDAIVKTFGFANYFETMAFVNAVATIAHVQDHHPDLSVHYNRCVVRFSTHDVGGVSDTDVDCARRIEALRQP